MENEIELRSEEVNEILGNVPSWLMRWGISIIFGILLLVIALAGFVNYPDIVNAQVTITSTHPAVNLVAKSAGKLSRLFVTDNQVVIIDQPLAIIENTALYEDIVTTKKIIAAANAAGNNPQQLPATAINNTLQLGDAQITYNGFVKALKEYNLFFELNPQLKEMAILGQQLDQYKNLTVKEQKQTEIYKEELDLIEKDYTRNAALFANQSISAKELDDKKREYLAAKRNYESIRITISNSEINASNIEKNLLQLKVQGSEQSQHVKQNYIDAVKAMEAAINIWEQNYLVKSPVAGKVALFNFWSNNQHVKAGDEIMSIIPTDSARIFGKCTMPVQNSGKVKVGQKVYIRLNNFPYQEFGVLAGKVASISKVPRQDKYSLEMQLPTYLITSYHKTIPYQPEMQGTAEIITQDLTLLQRIFYQLRRLTKI